MDQDELHRLVSLRVADEDLERLARTNKQSAHQVARGRELFCDAGVGGKTLPTRRHNCSACHLLRKLKPVDIVVLDNVGAGRGPLIRIAGARVLYLPPYWPDLNPIEFAWSKLKSLLREFGARTRDALDDAIRRAMDLIDGPDAAAWFVVLRLPRSALEIGHQWLALAGAPTDNSS